VRDLVIQRQVVSKCAKVTFKILKGLERFPPLTDRIAPEKLLTSDFTARAELELTTHCNLRCVYCRGSEPWGADMDLQYLPSIIDTLKHRGVLAVGVSGNGETLSIKDWRTHCDRMLDEGLNLFVTTNLARELSDEEAATLGRFIIVRVSCDTVRPWLFKRLRRGGDLKMLLYNMAKIRSLAITLGRKPPTFWWNAVVTRQTVFYLEEYVAFGLSVGVKHFCFMELCGPPPVDEGLEPVNHVTDMPLEELQRVPDLFQRVFAMIRENGGSFICNAVMDSVNERLQGGLSGTRTVDESIPRVPNVNGFTRNCLDPWIYARVSVDTSVKPCCITDEPMGFLNRGPSLEEILNSDAIKSYRSGILTGKLMPACRMCPNRGWTEIEKLYLKVLALSWAREVLTPLQRLGILLPLLHRWRR